MKKRVFVYAEQFDGIVDQSAGELVTAAKSLQSDLQITVFCVGKNEEKLIDQISFMDTETVLLDDCNTEFCDEYARAHILMRFLKTEKPSYILVPATDIARPLFARVAAALNQGMTADCTELYMENGCFMQKKPAFGDNAMVKTLVKSEMAFVTVVSGIYDCESCAKGKKNRFISEQEEAPTLKIEKQEEYSAKSISDAEVLISVGRGASSEKTFSLAQKLADKLGGYVGGTRPLVDSGQIPFEAQVGQTGCTVHPRVCLFFGVSGAIQHTEGVRDCKLSIAVNTDEDAGIFSFADYGTTYECGEMINALVNMI